LPTVSSTLAVDVMLPVQQANPFWLGAVQLYITCPSHNIYNAFLGQAELTGEALGVWNTLTFPVPSADVTSLLSSGYSDLTFSVVLNVAVPAGTYLIDHLRFLPVAATACASCAASDPCHATTCDPGTGACTVGAAVADWTPCNDGDLCNHAKACQAGVCGGGQTNCDDGDPCTTDTCIPSTGACGHSPLTSTACTSLLESAPPLQGSVAFASEPDNNRCVPDAVHVLNRMNARGELLGWQFSSAGPSVDASGVRDSFYGPLDGEHFHLETIARLPYFGNGSTLDGSYFVAANSIHPGMTGEQMLDVAQFAFKGGKQGKMLGTNRAFNIEFMSNGAGPFGASSVADWLVTPNPGDGFIPIIDPPATNPPILGVGENHPGGLSALGQHVVIPFQAFAENCGLEGEFLTVGSTLTFGLVPSEGASCTPLGSLPYAQILDLGTPTAPQIRASFLTHNNTPDIVVGGVEGEPIGGGTSAVSSSIAKLADGRFVLAVYKDSPKAVSQMEFYVSVGTDLDDPNVFGENGRAPDAIATPPDWQTFNFITDCNGTLFVLGTANNNGVDAIDNYEVDLTFRGATSTCGTPYCVTMTPVDQITPPPAEAPVGHKVMYCPDNSGITQCNMAAAAGAYVDPNGQVIVYATNYDNDGGSTGLVYGNASPFCDSTTSSCSTYPSLGGFVRGMEFHERHGNAGVGTACPTMADAWVEFYADPNFNNFGNGPGQMYRIDFPSYAERDNQNFGINDFNDKATSIRWCVPTGASFLVYNQEASGGGILSGSTAELSGTGGVVEISDLTQVPPYPHGGGSMNDSIRAGVFQITDDDPQRLVGAPDTSN
jgi:hypothetical protein